MKYVKMLGLAAVAAMALMAFVGAGTASATVLCKTNVTTNCGAGGWEYPTGTAIHTTLETNISMNTATLGGTPLSTCTGSTLKATSTSTGSGSETVRASVLAADWTWGNCTYPTTTTAGGELEIHHTAGTDHGVITAKGFTIELKNTPLGTCFTSAGNGTELGTVTPNGGTPTIEVDAIVVKHPGSAIFCPNEWRWSAKFQFTSPDPVYIAAS